MSNYKIEIENGFYYIFEKPSEQRIFKFKTYKEAKDQYKRLNNGVGFNGWTPMFVAEHFTKAG